MLIADPAHRFDPRRHHRRSVRLPFHSYADGVYFVTICTRNRGLLFGEVVEEEMALEAPGEIAWDCWLAIPDHFPHVMLDAAVVMPNHFHGILGILPPANSIHPIVVGAQHAAPLRSVDRNGRSNITVGSLPALVRSFKSAVTKRLNTVRGTPGAKVWQRNYYERVLRNERELDIARRYIADNPLRWHFDRYHPDRTR